MRAEAVGPDRKLAERLRTEKEAEINSPDRKLVEPVSFEHHKDLEVSSLRSRLADSTIVELERTLRQFRDLTGVKQLSDVTPALVEEFFAHRLQKVSVATANKDLRTLSASFNRPVDRRHLVANPASGIKQVREAERDIRVLSPEEVRKLLDACPSTRWKALVSLAVCSGMRRGELLALRWQDVDLEDGTVWVRNTPRHRTKSRRNRKLCIPQEVCDLLRKLPRKGELVFHTGDGSSMANNVQRGFNAVVRHSGIERCTLHDLRRTCLSRLAMAGVNAAVVQKLAGHASIATTVKHYIGILSEAEREAQSRLPFVEVVRQASVITHSSHKPGESETEEAPKIITLDPFRA